MKSTAVLRHSELRSVAESQQWQSELCRCTRLLQQSSFKVAKSIQAEYRDSELVRYHDRGTEADAEGINTTSMDAFASPLRFGHTTRASSVVRRSPCMVFTTFVLTHLLMQLGNGHASIPAALVLVNNHSCSHSFHKFICEGSFSLSAEAQVFVFLARPRSISFPQTNF